MYASAGESAKRSKVPNLSRDVTWHIYNEHRQLHFSYEAILRSVVGMASGDYEAL